ncbi:hypothetical protein [Acidiphilium cryptum]|uniref:Uncharacterized protein n=1 Tax=Acidiphilium cryptum (strain JF-5) TaxID=349163 RepID=A5FWN6_ACICJ|nr:hypothetical protein [Acidiphilium cryptum]ABQ30018.1 hypothetical protein Acry_0799 [Acidiphilium cryptum JF-5]
MTIGRFSYTRISTTLTDAIEPRNWPQRGRAATCGGGHATFRNRRSSTRGVEEAKKNQLNFELKLPQTEELDTKIDEAGLDTLEYNKRWGLYRVRLTKADITSKSEVLKELSQLAYDRRANA